MCGEFCVCSVPADVAPYFGDTTPKLTFKREALTRYVLVIEDTNDMLVRVSVFFWFLFSNCPAPRAVHVSSSNKYLSSCKLHEKFLCQCNLILLWHAWLLTGVLGLPALCSAQIRHPRSARGLRGGDRDRQRHRRRPPPAAGEPQLQDQGPGRLHPALHPRRWLRRP